MQFEPVSFENNVIGYSLRAFDSHFFFGTKAGSLEVLVRAFPKYKFSLLKQVHGTDIVEADGSTQQADGHFTSQKHLALVIQTADCLPILLSTGAKVFALHAGWRGLANPILEQAQTSDVKLAAIGPHIGAKNFEVHEDVASHFRTTSPQSIFPHQADEKYLISLESIAKTQIGRLFPRAQCLSLDKDTVADLEFHSYRRGKAAPERNYSFLVLL